MRWGNFEKFEIFQKIKKCWKLSKKRTKPKKFEKFHIEIFFENFQKILVLCAFQKISSIFGFFDNFEFFFKNLPKRMPAKVGECLSLSLPDSASISPGCCLPLCLH
jgi:hypothetical protein